jgi:hypothetical protein
MEAGSEGAVKNWQHQRVHRAPFRSRRTRLSPGLEKQHLRLRRHARGAGARGRDHPPDLELEQGQPPPPTARPAPAQEPQPVSHQSNPWQEPGAPAPPIGCALVRANSPGQGADGEHVRLDGAAALAPRNAAASASAPAGRRVTLGGARARSSRPVTSRDPCSSRAIV